MSLSDPIMWLLPSTLLSDKADESGAEMKEKKCPLTESCG